MNQTERNPIDVQQLEELRALLSIGRDREKIITRDLVTVKAEVLDLGDGVADLSNQLTAEREKVEKLRDAIRTSLAFHNQPAREWLAQALADAEPK